MMALSHQSSIIEDELGESYRAHKMAVERSPILLVCFLGGEDVDYTFSFWTACNLTLVVSSYPGGYSFVAELLKAGRMVLHSAVRLQLENALVGPEGRSET